MSVPHGKQRSGNLNGIIHGRSNANPLVIKVATRDHRRDGVNKVMTSRRKSHASHVIVDWDLGLVGKVIVHDIFRLRPTMVFN